MTDSNKHTPSLRFPEFLNDGEWSAILLKDAINKVTPQKKLPSSEYKTDGQFPVIDQSTNIIAGYSDDYSALMNTQNEDYIVFGDHTCTLKLVNHPFIQGADGIKIFRSKLDDLDTQYLYYYLLAHPILSKEYKRHFADLAEKIILFPKNLKEQIRIAKCFSSIDKQITATRSKLEQLKEHKRGLMQRLFPAKGETVPELRFPEFLNDGEWEERSFSDIFTFIPNNTLSRANLNNENGSVQNIHYGDVLIRFRECLNVQNEQLPFISDVQDIDRYYKVKLVNGDVIIADTAEDETVGKCTELVGHTNGIIVSGLHTIAIRPNKIFATGYLGFYINSNSYREQLTQIMQGVKVLSISKTAISQTKIHFPSSISEQGKIAHSLSSINDVIKSYEDKITALELHKKGLMQQLFPNLPHHETN